MMTFLGGEDGGEAEIMEEDSSGLRGSHGEVEDTILTEEDHHIHHRILPDLRQEDSLLHQEDFHHLQEDFHLHPEGSLLRPEDFHHLQEDSHHLQEDCLHHHLSLEEAEVSLFQYP